MTWELFLGLLFSILPVMELRGAIPLILDYGLRTGNPVGTYLILAVILNVLTIFLVYFFLDSVHHRLMKIKIYRDFKRTLVEQHIRRRVAKMKFLQGLRKYVALFFLISLPLPGTGVWTSTTVAWILGFDRKKSFITIALGAIIAGIVIYLLSQQILLGLFY